MLLRPNMYTINRYLYYSLVSLCNLEELIVSDNKRLNKLPDSVDEMKSLRMLIMSECDLTELPTRYVKQRIS